MPAHLEAPDACISLTRAAQLSGRKEETLRVRAMRGRLRTIKRGRDHLTTRRWLHEYLMSRDDTNTHGPPLPADYVPPE
jgi:hypothetical protein